MLVGVPLTDAVEKPVATKDIVEFAVILDVGNSSFAVCCARLRSISSVGGNGVTGWKISDPTGQKRLATIFKRMS